MPWRYVRLPCLQRSVLSSIHHPKQSVGRISLQCFSSINDRCAYSAATAQQSIQDGVALNNRETPHPLKDQTPLPQHSRFSKNAVLQAKPLVSETVKIAGLVRSVRKHKKVAFAQVSDGSTYKSIQAIFTRPEDAKDVQNGAYVELEGQWLESPGAGQDHELHVENVLCVAESDPEVSPIQKKSMSVDHLRTYPHLRLRIPLYSLLARVRNQAVTSVYAFYSGENSQDDEALFVQPPLITSSDCEGAGETFTVAPRLHPQSPSGQHNTKGALPQEQHYFRSQKYLTVSNQLHLEAFSAELADVWTLSPTFRAEESDTARHLSEFWMLEAEFRSVTDLEQLTGKSERLIRYIVQRLQNHRVGQELLAHYSDTKHRSPETGAETDLLARWEALNGPKWQTIRYADAITALEEVSATHPDLFQFKPTWNAGLQLEHERWIVANLGQNKPVFVTHYPQQQKPFYMLPTNLDPANSEQHDRQTVDCFDLLLPYGTCEVVGGSLREHRLEHLISNMREKGLLVPSSSASTPETRVEYPYLQPGESLNTLQWYTDLRRFGSSPHGGFGLGFDRLLMYLTGVTNVRDIVPFPRTWGVAHC